MNSHHVEEYLGAIYRLRESVDDPLPLPRLQNYLNYTLISVHEMIRKMEKEAYITYNPYHGVILTEKGEQIASALVRRHRIWERFLADKLAIPWDATHTIAGQLEHAAPELVTERLAQLMGDPHSCPHGSEIPETSNEKDAVIRQGKRLDSAKNLTDTPLGAHVVVISISPEIPEFLVQLENNGIIPGVILDVTGKADGQVEIEINGDTFDISHILAETVLVKHV
jgi:DtxR family Mn-dependent transcriptional regulator